MEIFNSKSDLKVLFVFRSLEYVYCLSEREGFSLTWGFLPHGRIDHYQNSFIVKVLCYVYPVKVYMLCLLGDGLLLMLLIG